MFNKSKIIVIIALCILITELVYSVEKIPIWKITPPDSKASYSYIIGTIHIMPNDYQLPEFLQLLLDQCDELILEADMVNLNPWEVVEHCFYKPSDKKTLKDNFNKKDWAKILKLAEFLKIPLNTLLKYKPWYFSTDSSVRDKTNVLMPDMIFHKSAIYRKKKVFFLEKTVDQYQMFIKMPDSEINGMIMELAHDIKKVWKSTEDIQVAYKKCDIPLMDELIHGESFRTKYPSAYNALFTIRNKKWIPFLENI